MKEPEGDAKAGQRLTLGEFVLVEQLGSAPTYLAEEPLLKRRVVVRLLGISDQDRPGDSSSTLSRLRAASRVNHPSLVTIHGLGTADGQDYAAFEQVEGIPLAEWRSRQPREVLRLAVPLAEALAEAHQQGVCHGKLGLDRILFTPRGTPKLMGLGLCGSPGEDAESARRRDVRDFGALLGNMLGAASPRWRPQRLTQLLAQMQTEGLAGALSMTEIVRDLHSLDAQMEKARRRRVAALLCAASVACIAVILAITAGRPPAEPSRLLVAVIGFDEPASRNESSELGSMLTRLVSSDLSAARGLEVVGDQKLQETAYRLRLEHGSHVSDLTADVAHAVGADRVVVGRVRRDSNGVLASAELLDAASRSVLASAHARVASADDVFELAANLSRQLRAALQIPDLTDAERNALADQLTTSVDAYRAYVRGLDAILRADMPAAVNAFRLATALDPAFAAAQFRLAMALTWTGDLLEATKADERAVAFRERLPPELLPVFDAIGSHLGQDDSRAALPALLRCRELDPDNHDVLYILGEIYTHSATCSDSRKAFEIYEHLLSLAPHLSMLYEHALSSLLRQGKSSQAEEWADRWQTFAPANMPQLRGTLALWAGRYEDASGLLSDPLIPDFLSGRADAKSVQRILHTSTADLMEELKDHAGPYLTLDLDLRADILVAHGKFQQADDLYRRAAGIPGLIAPDGFFTSLRSGTRQRSALLSQLLGRADAARDLVTTALEHQSESYRCLYMAGLIALQQGESERARADLAKLNDLVQQALGPSAVLYRDALAAELALAEGHFAEAQAGFARLLQGGQLLEDWYAHEDSIAPFVRDGLARAEVSLGRADEALAAWAALSEAGLERLRAPIPWTLSFFERGRLAMRHGRTEEGRGLLNSFLEKWGSADEPIPQVAEARALLGL
jgi:tetratricopeptide (TPR) repeat protein